mgnify:CR=1 FL=1
MELNLSGKVALITGGSQGIGLAVAEGLAAEGVHLVLSARHEKVLQKAVSQIKSKFDVEVTGIQADVTQAKDLDMLVRRAINFQNHVDILINNAGTGTNETIENSNDDDWYYFWDLHVMAAVRLSRALLPHMRKNGGGVILNNASICATQPLHHEPIYNTTKAALLMFGKCLAHEAIKANIRVNTVNPGLIRTEGWEKAAREEAPQMKISQDKYLQDIAEEFTPIGRFASPQELANFFVFLCSEQASYAVGSSIYVDGGWLKTIN